MSICTLEYLHILIGKKITIFRASESWITQKWSTLYKKTKHLLFRRTLYENSAVKKQ